MRIRNKIVSYFLGTAFLFSLIGYYSYQYTEQVGVIFDAIESDYTPSSSSLIDIIFLVQQAAVTAKKYISDNSTKNLEETYQTIKKIEKRLKTYNASMENQSPAALYRLSGKIKHFRDAIESHLSLDNKTNSNIADSETQIQETQEQLLLTLEPLIQIEKNELKQASLEARRNIESAADTLIISIITITITSLILGLLIARSITTPLQALNSAARDIAKGNLDTKLNITSKSELSELATSFDEMRKELKNHQEDMADVVKQRTLALEDSNKELESYSYSIAHDLRAPLRSIVGFSQIILEDSADKLDKESQKHLQRIIKATLHMSELIDDILEMSRVSLTQIQFTDVNLSNICINISRGLSGSSPDRTVQWDIQDDIITKGDRNLLYLVLSNLLGNSWKFTKNTPQPMIEFKRIYEQDEEVYLIRDNGAGFDMKYVDKLFGLFQRLHSPGEYTGTGLGLATVQRVINRHGGWVRAESELGKGSSFYFSIPK